VLTGLLGRGLIDDQVVSQILSQEHTGFSVWLGEPFEYRDSSHFVAHYIERGPLSLERILIQDDIVTYTTKDGAAHEFDALEFLALLSSRIANPYEALRRYYGFWSCRSRGERKKRRAAAEKLDIQEPPP